MSARTKPPFRADHVGSLLRPKEVLAALATPETEPRVTLTLRQREVLRLIVKGHRMKEIAAMLNLSTRTVETHKYEIMRQLGVQSTVELVRYALERGLA